VLTPRQLGLLQASFDQIWSVNNRVADLFYERLFVVAPHTRALFPADMRPQKMKFMAMLASAIGLIERREMFEELIADLGRRHRQYGVGFADYASVGDALLWSLEQALAPQFTNETRAAWQALYQSARDIMISVSSRN
jgi:hemoglobin-like flavoprotein